MMFSSSRHSSSSSQGGMSTEPVLFRHTALGVACRRRDTGASGRNIGVKAHTSTAVRPTYDRILRYPDGAVRTIRYPDDPVAQSGVETAGSEGAPSDWHICGENDSSCTFSPNFDDESSLPGAAPVEQLWGTVAPSKQVPPADKEATPFLEEFDQLPASPAALLEFLASDAYRQAQGAHTDQVHESFKILHGCPWVAQRPLLTVAVPQRSREEPAAYTLPVAVQQDDHGAELARLVGDPSLAGKLTHRRMQDGVIAFADASAAMQFRDKLQAAGSLAAALTEVDSHALFRASADAQHVVVLVGPEHADSAVAASTMGAHVDDDLDVQRKDVFVPSPAELAAALRGPSPTQDW
eukprot:jgi/Ulvmu1/3501/UM162_0008.1